MITLHRYEVEDIGEAIVYVIGLLTDADFDADSPAIEGLNRALEILQYTPQRAPDALETDE